MTESTDRRIELANSLTLLKSRLSTVAENTGRKVEEIELLPITKFFPAADINILTGLGCRSFGEARDQEARAKIEEARRDPAWPADVRWHMVGQIQRNKARSIATWAAVVHSVSSARVAAALDRGATDALAAGHRAEPLGVYVQISLDGDVSRGGVDVNAPAEVDALCAQVDAAEGLKFVGLMGVPPLDSDPDAAFAALAAELRRVQDGFAQRLGLSAGMTQDLEIAVKHGSTCVRVGTALMGPRPLTSP
ncbi:MULTISPECIES: YggS family pyridoxal phosphate-dependent enzyme [Mycolicibacterium]|uniref:Pyridoxal phosphate homeostasis protein n=1 Tax=Mycolicibacterium chitae TaxID=1792 RepID=A0A448I5Q3_MYCCI|nr:YggS family pyridoxal phosphate-dependent enzyme [Mycolicibacterium chitae]MCV7107344.1 YggS family pyridoxal phosphate-dependent enzyme [Mycolicibacterium chitae]VEG47690.1 pyridoxal phosphate enzyme, YggS family [Mycolicibacterium chitae]